MFSVSDIKEDVYPAVYRRGKELYETGGVLDFAYDIYLEHDLPEAKKVAADMLEVLKDWNGEKMRYEV